jgi:predicted nucleic acid-binding protein
MIFLDASAAVKAYVNEPGSSTIEGVRRRLAGNLFLTPHVALEVLTTFAKLLRTSSIRRAGYASARGRFLGDYPRGYRVVQVGDREMQLAYALADAHRRVGVGAMDVLHIASALELQHRLGRARHLVVASSDRSLLALAAAVGLSTFDPESEPLGALLTKIGRR